MPTPTHRFVGITWREIKTGRVNTQKNEMLTQRLTSPDTIIKALNTRVWLKIISASALLCIIHFAYTLHTLGWTFIGHTPQFWHKLINVLFQQ